MTVTAETVAIEVIARLDKAKSGIADLDRTFETSTGRMQQAAKTLDANLDRVAQNSATSFTRVGSASKKAADEVDRSSGRIANAQRNLGRQISDVTTQLAGGQNPGLIFAQQAPQIADALADTGGRAAKLASFFAGPWGAAILGAGSILATVLVPRLFEGSDAADTMSKSQIDLARFVDTTTGAINRQTTAVQRLAAAQARQNDVEAGTRTYVTARSRAISAAKDAAGVREPVFTAGFRQPDAVITDPVKKQLRDLAAEAAKGTLPINDFALAVRKAVGDRPEYRSLVKTITAQAAAAVDAAQGVQKLKAEQAVLTGTATAQQKALLGIGAATTSLVEKQVALQTSTTALEKARARLALVEEKGRGIQAGDAKALNQYRSELTSAHNAVNAAEAAERAAAQSKRDHAKATRDAAKAVREQARENRIAARAERELLALRSDQASSLSDLTSDPRQQDDFARQRIRLDQAGRISDLDERRSRGDLDAAEYAERKKVVDEITANRLLLVDRNAMIREQNNGLELERQRLGNQQDILRAQQGLARTSEERRQLELKLLDLGIEEQRLTAQKVLDLAAQGKASPQEAALARGTLDALPDLRRYGAAAIERNNQGPLASYLNGIPRAGAEMKEALEGVAVNGVERLNDSLATAASSFLKLRGVAGEAISGIIADLARLYLRRGILTLLGRFLPGAGGAAGLLTGAAASAVSPNVSSLPRLASGGTIRAGGLGGVDRNVLSVNGVPKAMISAHETLSVINPAMMAAPIRSAAPNITINQHFNPDMRGSITTKEFTERLVNYADGRAAQARDSAVAIAGQQAPERVARYQRFRS